MRENKRRMVANKIGLPSAPLWRAGKDVAMQDLAPFMCCAVVCPQSLRVRNDHGFAKE